jgi:hypothetical protein
MSCKVTTQNLHRKHVVRTGYAKWSRPNKHHPEFTWDNNVSSSARHQSESAKGEEEYDSRDLIMFSKLVTTSSLTPARIMSPCASSRTEIDLDGVAGCSKSLISSL